MKIVKHYSLQHSDKVLKHVRKLLPKVKGDITLQSWSNGREQGYHLSQIILGNGSYNVFGINFAQQRNSDFIVVIHGSAKDFDLQTNHPNDAAWNRRKEFSNYIDAAYFIVETLWGHTLDIQKV
jgi:hypothetical protein